MTKESHVDVLVIGAGPTGLFATNALVKAGVNVKVIDQRPIKVAAGQADGIQPRTLEVLKSYGLVERLLNEGNQMHMAAFYNPSPNGGIELTERVPDTTAPTARYPFEVTLHQGAIENIFLDSMAASNLTVTRPCIPTSITISENEKELRDPQAHPIKVVVQNLAPQDGEPDTEVIHAKFVVGADGAHSWVRKALGIKMEGEQTDYIWGVVDLVPESNFPDMRNKCVIHSEKGTCLIIPREGDGVRLYIQLSDKGALDSGTGRIDRTKVTPHKLFEVAQTILQPFTIETPKSFDWWTLYIIGQRVASNFSINERAFIAGDACHTHSPKAGQGMNAGMNDSHNLAWKLIHVLRGWADISLLKTYEAERRAYAQDLINFDKKFAKLFSTKPQTEDDQDGVTHEEVMHAFQIYGLFTTGIGIHYTGTPIVDTKYQSLASGLVIGQRILPQIFLRATDSRPYEIQDLIVSDTRFKILVFVGDTGDAKQRDKLNKLAEEMKGVLSPRAPGGSDVSKVFDIMTFGTTKKEKVIYNDVPPFFRSHWSKVFIDDVDTLGKIGGNGYEYYGIDKKEGAIVVVRPDGYVGTIAPFHGTEHLKNYFASFMSQA